MNTFSFKCHISLDSRVQKMLKVSSQFPEDITKESSTLDHHLPSLCGGRNTKSNWVTLEAQLQRRVKFSLGDNLFFSFLIILHQDILMYKLGSQL